MNPTQPQHVEKSFGELAKTIPQDLKALLKLLHNYSQLTSQVNEFIATANIDYACHNNDPIVESRYLYVSQKLKPVLQVQDQRIQQIILQSPALDQLHRDWDPVIKRWEIDVQMFSKNNLPLFSNILKYNAEYDKVLGQITIEFDYRLLTLQQLSQYEINPDRNLRKQAWTLGASKRLDSQDTINGLFEKVVHLRHQVAQNAGFKNYQAYAMKKLYRFDYDIQACQEFHNAVAETCVPLVNQLDAQQAESLELTQLRPWDHIAPSQNQKPLAPFDGQNPEELHQFSVKACRKIAPWMGESLALLQQEKNLDLISRPGKRSGGFQSSIPSFGLGGETGEPFIFMNAVGTSDDVRTFLHECGHVFHYMESIKNLHSIFMHHAPTEFCEVASMSLELLTLHTLDVFYPDTSDYKRAKKQQLESIIRLLPWIATIDSFQHAIYSNPESGIEQWSEIWLQITDRFGTRHGGPNVDWSGYEREKQAYWQRQMHLFHAPFYYIEYGIAQIGALQVWSNYKKDPYETLCRYREALCLGGTRSLPQLFETCGIHFDFSAQTLKPLMDLVQDELAALDE